MHTKNDNRKQLPTSGPQTTLKANFRRESLWYHACIHVMIYQYVTGFRKIDHIVTIDIARNTDLKY